MTSGILEDMKLLMPIVTQTLTTAVTFTLGDNSEVSCTEIAYVDMVIHTHEDIINIKGVPVFILPGPPGQYPLRGLGTKSHRPGYTAGVNGLAVAQNQRRYSARSS